MGTPRVGPLLKKGVNDFAVVQTIQDPNRSSLTIVVHAEVAQHLRHSVLWPEVHPHREQDWEPILRPAFEFAQQSSPRVVGHRLASLSRSSLGGSACGGRVGFSHQHHAPPAPPSGMGCQPPRASPLGGCPSTDEQRPENLFRPQIAGLCDRRLGLGRELLPTPGRRCVLRGHPSGGR